MQLLSERQGGIEGIPPEESRDRKHVSFEELKADDQFPLQEMPTYDEISSEREEGVECIPLNS